MKAHSTTIVFRLALLALAIAAFFVALSGPAAARESDAAASETESTRTLYLVLIRQARIDGRARAALAYLDDFDRRWPKDRDAQVLRVNCLLDLDQDDAAAAALAPLADVRGDAQVYAVRGHVAAARGDWRQAVEAYGESLAARPVDPLVSNALGYALLETGEPARAIEALGAARDLAPGDATIRNNLALAYAVAGDRARADAIIAAIPGEAERSLVRIRLGFEAERLARGVHGKPAIARSDIPAALTASVAATTGALSAGGR